MSEHEKALRELRRATRALSGACLERLVRPRRDGGLPDAFLQWLVGESA